VTTLRLGSTGPEVTVLRERLGVPDEFGHELDKAVRAFQARSGLLVDGVAGPKTMAELAKSEAPVILAPEPPLEASEKRALVDALARKYLGYSDPSSFWERCGVHRPYPPAWCGAFALSCLIEAELCEWPWLIGKGFLFRLPTTKSPEIGDISYFEKHQHHAVVGSGGQLINGNGVGGRVSLSIHDPSKVTAYYTIASLL
jgi:hypothetical protein